MIRSALLSVSDKTGIVELAKSLHARGVKLLSTGGTASALRAAQIEVIDVSTHTGAPEILDGRVKTLHPKIHGGILARRDLPAHLATLTEHAIEAIDAVIVNLYPFAHTIATPDCTFEAAIEQIDIGGPTLLRAAAKNHNDVWVLCEPSDYQHWLTQLDSNDLAAQRRLKAQFAAKVFAHTARYDATIAAYLTAQTQPTAATFDSTSATNSNQALNNDQALDFPDIWLGTWFKKQSLRYGENPHQQAALYQDFAPAANSLAAAQQLQGKELSYNNLADADAAWACVQNFELPACVIVKHANPCGVAMAQSAQLAYQQALQTDAISAFGGIVAFNCAVDENLAQQLTQLFIEVLIAPEFSPKARTLLATKANLRVLQIQLSSARERYHYHPISGGLLVQSADRLIARDWRVVTTRIPTAEQQRALTFAWQVAQYVKSNAIVFANGDADHAYTLGIGAGQMSRLDSALIAGQKAQTAKLSLHNSCVASDAFFPFRDGLDVLAQAGACCVIQPGGSMRDAEVIEAANQHGMAMLFTGERHFRH